MPCFWEVRRKVFLVLAAECFLCCAVLAQDVSTTYAPGYNFSKYHTYKWVEIKGLHPDPTVDAQIKQSFDSQLAARGLTKAEGTADLNVDYQTAIRKQQTWQPYEDWTNKVFRGLAPRRKLVMIPVGTLVLDMYDVAAKTLIWNGRAEKALDPNSSREDRQRNLDKVTKKLLSDFPPK